MNTFDWPLAIRRNFDELERIVLTLFALAGISGGRTVATLPRYRYARVLLILRPAESAVRRLIIIAARGMKVTVRSPKRSDTTPSNPVILGPEPRQVQRRRCERTHSAKSAKSSIAKNSADSPGAFPLLDPLKRFDVTGKHYATTIPRISALCRDWSVPVYLRQPEPPAKPEPSPDDHVDAARLCRRLQRLRDALADLDGQALRLARFRARRALAGPVPGTRSDPMRPGWPPGHRKRPIHDIDEVLRECHSLAVYARSLPDTS